MCQKWQVCQCTVYFNFEVMFIKVPAKIFPERGKFYMYVPIHT